MARFLATALLVLSAHTAYAETTDDVASEAGVSAQRLTEALAVQDLTDAREYLYAVNELQRPVPLVPYNAQVECLISKESGGLDIPNRQGSGASGPGQYFQSSWARHVALYRAATGYAGQLSLHATDDVRLVMAFVLTAYPRMRSEWSVSGC